MLIGAFLLVLFLWNLFPEAAEWNPLVLVSRNMDMLQGTLLLEDLLNPLLITGLIIASSLFTAGKLFSKTTL